MRLSLWRATGLSALLSINHAAALPPSEFENSATVGRPNIDRVMQLIMRGDARRDVGDTLTALGYYRDAISAAPRRSEGYRALGALYLAIDEPTRALEVYHAAVDARIQAEDVWLAHAATLDALGQPGRALDVLRQFSHMLPTSTAGQRALAEHLETRGQFVEALTARRAELVQTANAETSHVTRRQVRALEHLLGAAERVRSREVCSEAHADAVARALADCL